MWKKIESFLFKNKTPKQTVAKNTIWLTVSNFGGRLVKAVIVIYAARALGTSEYGIFSYAVALAGTLGIFMEPGINSVLMREASKVSDEERRTVFAGALFIKIILVIIGAFIIIFLGPSFTTLPGAKILLPIAALIMTFDTLREFMLSLLRSREKMQWDASIFIFTNFAIVIFGFIFILHNQTALALTWGYAIGTTLGGIFAVIVVWRDIVEAVNRFSMKVVIPIFQAAWPFAITGALGLLFTNTDILIISWMKTSADVGVYSAAIRIIQILYLVPYVIQTSTLPLFSRLAKHDNEKFRVALEKSVGLIFLISLPLAIGGIILGTQVITFIFGNSFANGSLAFKLLLATLVVDYPGSLIVNAIFAYGHQKSLIVSSAIGGIINVALDLLFIPRWGMTGSAAGTLIAQIVTNGYIWYMMRKINYFEIVPYLKRMFAASIIMGFATFVFILLGIHVIANKIFFGIIYFVLLWIFREPELSEIVNIIKPKAA